MTDRIALSVISRLLLVVSAILWSALPAWGAVPGAPTIGVTSAGSGQTQVNFLPPASDGGSPVLDYTVTSSPGGLTATGTGSPLTVTGLTNGTTYTYTVTARNAEGSGPASAPSIISTPRLYAPTGGTINNLVFFIRFSDQPAFSQALSYYHNLFNADPKSLKNFYLESSYGALTVNSFFPRPAPSSLSSDGFAYLDVHPTGYYQPYHAVSNPVGYTDATQGTQRETELIGNALAAVADQAAASGFSLDNDGDGYVDHITIEVYSSQANPQPTKFYSRATYDTSKSVLLNGLKVGSYTWVAAAQDTVDSYPAATAIHEMGHSLGYPDLRSNGPRNPVGNYDVMSLATPVHSGAWEKFRFTGWLPALTELAPDAYGGYLLDSIASQSSPNSRGYKIKIPNSSEFLVLEYRKATGPFESNLPGSGLCVTRVNEAAGMWGNLGGPPFYLYYFRPGGTLNGDGIAANMFSCLSSETGHVQFNDYSDPPCFTSSGSSCGISIDNIGSTSGSTISFTLSDPATTVVKRIISGYLYNGGSRVSGATVALSGDATATTTTDSLGRYLFVVNTGGNYTVTPTKTYLSFTPASASYQSLASDQVQNYAGLKATNTLAGTVSNGGQAMSGVLVAINCPAGGNYVGSTSTDSGGNFSFTVDSGSSCTIWPSKTNYNFLPSSKNYSTIATNQSQAFATNGTVITISGKITLGSGNLAGIAVDCPGASSAAPVTTDANGQYQFTAAIGTGQSYTVTPASPLFTFNPVSRSFAQLVGNQSNQNFAATASAYTLTVNLSGNAGAVSSIPAGISCALPGAVCQQVFGIGTGVSLVAVASGTSAFSGWSGDCSGTGNCGVTMSADRSVSASFSPIPLAENHSTLTPYLSLAGALQYASSGAEIRVIAGQVNENVSLDQAVTLRGSFDGAFQAPSGTPTDLNGSLTVTGGSSTVESVSVRTEVVIRGGRLAAQSLLVGH